MTSDRFSRDRAISLGGAILLPGLLGWALLSGLAVHMPRTVTETLSVFGVAPPPPPPPEEKVRPHPVRSRKPEGAASPPNLRSKMTEVVAPPPIVPVIVPPPVIAAVKAGVGADSTAGAADIRGSGTGAGGEGDGTGSGRYGDGDGDGGDEIPPRHRSGRLKDSDYPEGGGARGTVGVRYTVAINGRVSACEVMRSSGNRELDDLTCRLIQQRFRFDPSRDARGRPVEARIVENHEWVVEDLPAER